jgi:hypothetical protein
VFGTYCPFIVYLSSGQFYLRVISDLFCLVCQVIRIDTINGRQQDGKKLRKFHLVPAALRTAFVTIQLVEHFDNSFIKAMLYLSGVFYTFAASATFMLSAL